MDFPIENFTKSQDGTEDILGGSVGINRILLMFKNKATIDNAPRWSLYLLNAFSILRNVFDARSPQTIKQLRDAVLTDCELFTTYLEAYLSHLRHKPPGPVPLILYFPDYNKIPPDLRRDKKGKDQEIEAKYKELCKTFPQSPTQTSAGEYTVRWILPVGRQVLPHFELSSWLRTYAMENNQLAWRWGTKTFLFTHCPIDLHIHRRIPQVELIESYTAAIKPPIEFGTKLVKDPPIPFNVITHRAFGDPVHIAPMATHKVRSDLLAQAELNKWMRQPPEAIASSISSRLDVPLSELVRIKF